MMKDKMKTNMSNKRKVGFKRITKMMAVAGAALMMVGCATNSNATKSGNEATGSTVKIGMNMELSGAAAGYGNQMKKGFELAVNEINAAGGIKVGDKKMKIEPVILDNKSTTSGAASVAAQLPGAVYRAGLFRRPSRSSLGKISLAHLARSGELALDCLANRNPYPDKH